MTTSLTAEQVRSAADLLVAAREGRLAPAVTATFAGS